MIISIERDGERVSVRTFGAKFRDWRRWVVEAGHRAVYEVDGRMLRGLCSPRHGWRSMLACHAAASLCETRGRLLATTLTGSRRVA